MTERGAHETLEFRFVPATLRGFDETPAELVACSIWSDARPFGGVAGLLDWRLAGRLTRLARDRFLLGTAGEVVCLPGRPRLPFDKVLLFGLGPRDEFDDDACRKAVERLLGTLAGLAVRRAVVELPGRNDGVIDPVRAAELVLECAGTSPHHEAWWLVEEGDAEARIAARAQAELRRLRRV